LFEDSFDAGRGSGDISSPSGASAPNPPPASGGSPLPSGASAPKPPPAGGGSPLPSGASAPKSPPATGDSQLPSGPPARTGLTPAGIDQTTQDQLRAFVQRIERLEEEKAALSADLKEVYAEAKSFGFDTKALRTIIALRKQDEDRRREADAILEIYLIALGMAGAPE
jgi:uncharacterized protein (UPF0335 family)